MSQTSWIAGFLVMGFILFVIAKGQLPQYRAVVGI